VRLLEIIGKPGSASRVSIFIFLLFVLIFESLLQADARKIATDDQFDTLSYGSILRARTERELNALLYLSNGLTGYLSVYHGELDRVKINAVLDNLYARSKHIRNFAVAVGYKITYIAPRKANEKALGLDYTLVPDQWPDVKRAVDSKQGVLVGPVALVQGGSGLIYRYPIFIDGQYWGLLSTVIDMPSFLAGAFGEMSSNEYVFAVRTKDSNQTFYGNAGLFKDPRAVLIDSDVPGGKWQFAVVPVKLNPELLFLWVIRILTYAISALLALAAYILLRDRANLAQQAMYDSLTGLANRRLLMDRLDQTIYRLQRDENATCAVFFFDLDHFKKINDRFGHKTGDIVLMTIAQRVREEIRASDTVARLGGDEFVIVIVERKNSTYIHQLEERLRSIVRKPIEMDGYDLHVDVSIGLALYPQDGKSTGELLKSADERMYMNKQRTDIEPT
jgi:diguanylate cyclase (GGDEF)-like protein